MERSARSVAGMVGLPPPAHLKGLLADMQQVIIWAQGLECACMCWAHAPPTPGPVARAL